MCDSVAYSISRATLNQLYHSSIGLANLGLRLMDHQLLLQENWLINSGSPRAKERYLTLIKETPELLQYVPLKYIAGKLEIKVGDPILVRKRFVYDPEGCPLEWNIGYYRADSFIYSLEFERNI